MNLPKRSTLFFSKLRNLKVGKSAIRVYKDASYGPYGCGNDKKLPVLAICLFNHTKKVANLIQQLKSLHSAVFFNFSAM